MGWVVQAQVIVFKNDKWQTNQTNADLHRCAQPPNRQNKTQLFIRQHWGYRSSSSKDMKANSLPLFYRGSIDKSQSNRTQTELQPPPCIRPSTGDYCYLMSHPNGMHEAPGLAPSKRPSHANGMRCMILASLRNIPAAKNSLRPSLETSKQLRAQPSQAPTASQQKTIENKKTYLTSKPPRLKDPKAMETTISV